MSANNKGKKGYLTSAEEKRAIMKNLRAWKQDSIPRIVSGMPLDNELLPQTPEGVGNGYPGQGNNGNGGDLFETFEMPFPTYTRAVLIGTDTFEPGTEQAQWVHKGGPVTYSYVTDPSPGAPHGTCKKVSFTQSLDQKPYFYAETFGSQNPGNLQGIYSGRVEFYLYSDLANSFTGASNFGLNPKFKVLNRGTTPDPIPPNNDLDKGYAISYSGSNQFSVFRVNPDEFGWGMDATSQSLTANVWHHHRIEWFTIVDPMYGNLVYITYAIDGVNKITKAPTSIPYYYDIETLQFPGSLGKDDPLCRITFQFLHRTTGTHFILMDSVSWYRYEGVALPMPLLPV